MISGHKIYSKNAWKRLMDVQSSMEQTMIEEEILAESLVKNLFDKYTHDIQMATKSRTRIIRNQSKNILSRKRYRKKARLSQLKGNYFT
jgi:hypothetical protein